MKIRKYTLVVFIIILSIVLACCGRNTNKTGAVDKHTTAEKDENTLNSMSEQENTIGHDAPLTGETRNYLQTVIVRIKEWNKDGCYGVVTDARDHDVFKDGDEIFVEFGNDLIKIIYGDGSEVIFYNDKPADEICDIGAGSEICVKFYSFDNDDWHTIYATEVREVGRDE